MSRVSLSLPIILLLSTLTAAKDKNKSVLPQDVLRAQTVFVVISPDAGEPVADPGANRRARQDVEESLMKWGRFQLAVDSTDADLVIAVRKGTGRLVSPTIGNSPIDNRPVILEPNTDAGVRIGAQQGKPPDLTQPGLGGPQSSGPRTQTEVGPSQDTFEVYRGKVDYPLDSSAVWRYSAKDALRPPTVSAVDQFRKAIDEAEKAAAEKKTKQKP